MRQLEERVPKKYIWKEGGKHNILKYKPVADVTKISSVVLKSPEPSSQSSSSSQDGRSIFSLCGFGLSVVGNRVGATYTGVMMSSGNRSNIKTVYAQGHDVPRSDRWIKSRIVLLLPLRKKELIVCRYVMRAFQFSFSSI